MEIKQQLRLSQQLVMTPQLQQAIRLLQLSRLELIDEIRQELDGNPMLADEDIDPRAKKGATEEFRQPGEAPDGHDTPVGMVERIDASDIAKRDEDKRVQDIDWEQFLENRASQQPGTGTRNGFEELPPIDPNLTRRETLVEHLRQQLQISDFTPAETRFAELVLGNLDDNGFLDLGGVESENAVRTDDFTLEEFAEEAGLNPEDAPEVLRLMQEWDPIGTCSRNLRECLHVQAVAAGFDELELAIIDHHLPNLERHNYAAIARDLKASLDDVYEAIKEIQKLESRPARNFYDTDDKSIGITPDVFVVKEGDNYVVTDNDRGLQRLYINEVLTKQLLRNPQAKEFVGEKLRSAQWLIRAIEQRRKTIVRVTECIVEKQRDFFERGVAYLKPMILRDVAETVGMHESTISRVTTNKYVNTPQGLFELKYFFNSSIRRVTEDDISSESVKQAILKIVDLEAKAAPFSDQQIVEMLVDRDGIQIARRTVAKYREMLGILASGRRRKVF